jgi:hypothetical protein
MQPQPTDLKTMASGMESIGRNCEFGFVQGAIGVDQISLLRWAGAPMEAVINGLSTRFDGLLDRAVPDEPDKTRLEWWLTCAQTGILFHTGRGSDRFPDIQDAAADCQAHFRRLAVKLLDDIAAAEKLFVFSDATLTHADDARPLWEELRRIGPRASLLVVSQDAGKAGTVETLREGMIAGYVPRLTSMGAANQFDIDAWSALIIAANNVWREERSISSVG